MLCGELSILASSGPCNSFATPRSGCNDVLLQVNEVPTIHGAGNQAIIELIFARHGAPTRLDSPSPVSAFDRHIHPPVQPRSAPLLSTFTAPNTISPSRPTYTASAAAFLPSYFAVWFYKGIYVIAIGYPLNVALGLFNVYTPVSLSRALGGHGGQGGLGKAMRLIREIIEEDGGNVSGEKDKRPSTMAMAEWIRMNALRSVATALPA
ncbi:hypothetical protein FRB96_007819 [Tulasnella sp. 330]|nr:hypothetical protein FRB96_007819 [Tulasnella sp. 330]